MKFASSLGLVCAGALLVSLPAVAQGQPGKTDTTGPADVNVVLRISRKLVEELTTRQVQRTTPVHQWMAEGSLDGVAFTEATASVEFTDPPDVPAFTVLLRGTTRVRVVLTRPPVAVFGSAHMDFVLRKRITFNGEKFRSQPTVPDARFCATVDGLATPPGVIGLIVELIARHKIRREHPGMARQGFAYAKSELVAAFDEEVEKKLAGLNKVSPLEQTVNTLFPETKDWIFYPLRTPTHLLIGAGPAGRKLPELPVTEKTDAPIELWIRTKPETQGMIAVMKLWRDANKQLETMLPGELGKRLKLGEGFNTLTVKDWFVIQLGRGVFKDAKPPPKMESVSWPMDSRRPLFAEDRVVGPGADVERITVIWRPVRQ